MPGLQWWLVPIPVPSSPKMLSQPTTPHAENRPKSHIYTPCHGTGSSFKALIYSLNSLHPLKAFDPHPQDPERPGQFNSPFNLLRALASSETASSGRGSTLPDFAGLNSAVPLSFSCKNHYLKSQGEFSLQLSTALYCFF